jgi:hypothetical protein
MDVDEARRNDFAGCLHELVSRLADLGCDAANRAIFDEHVERAVQLVLGRYYVTAFNE